MWTCNDCRFSEMNGETGSCNRWPPRVLSVLGSTHEDEPMQRWPRVHMDDWCGEHQPKKPAPSLEALEAAIGPFLVAAEAMGAETGETLIALDLTDENGDAISLHSDDFLKLAEAFAKATGS